MLETIKSYLVSLGFSVDKSSYNEATKSMANAEKSVAQFAGSAVAQFAAAGAAVASFVVAANIGLAKFIGDLAQADLANEKLARQLWTSKDNAAAFNNTLKAMKVELGDLYLSTELMKNFQALRQQAGNMRAPQEFGDMMKQIRSIQFEFTRMKLEATYALQWIGYYLVKYMGGPIKDIKLTLKEINDVIIKTMPSWTKVVAQVMSWFGQMGVTTVRAIKDIARVFDDIGQGIPKNLKLIGGAAAALGLILSTGPLGILIATFTVAILLLNDFYTYLDGGKSKFGPFWKKLIEFYDKLKESGGVIDQVKGWFKDAFKVIGDGFEGAKKFVTDLYTTLQDNGTIDSMKQTFQNTFDIVSGLIGTAIKLIKEMYGELDKQGVLTDLKNNFEGVTSAVWKLEESVTGLLKALLGLDGTKTVLNDIGDVLKLYVNGQFGALSFILKNITNTLVLLAKAFKGDFSGLLKSYGEMATEMFKNVASGNIGGSSNVGSSSDAGATYGPPTPSYLLPNSNTQNTNTNSVSLQQTNNIYGSDPNATGDAVVKNTKAMIMRNLQGVFGP